jgi:hypothetical protein
MTPNDIDYIVIHHSLTPDGPKLSYDDIKRYHIEHNKWADIGYHIVIEDVEGTILTIIARPWSIAGAHAPGKNSNSLGICLVGDFDQSQPSPAMLQAAVRVVKWLRRFFDVPLAHVIGHREATAQRTCPGAHFDLDAFRASLV